MKTPIYACCIFPLNLCKRIWDLIFVTQKMQVYFNSQANFPHVIDLKMA